MQYRDIGFKTASGAASIRSIEPSQTSMPFISIVFASSC
jgi:hypothetical protein